jgi:5-methylcytosine-specific restriction endonuclease McrA
LITLCALCNAEFEARTSYGLCKNCWQRDRLREWDRLEAAKKHVRRTGVPIKLTLVEWLSIVSDFQGHCAYCLVQPYSVIEMVKPYRGLVRDNVVPACRSCDVHVHGSFESAEERVQAYVESEPTIHLFEDAPEPWEVEV